MLQNLMQNVLQAQGEKLVANLAKKLGIPASIAQSMADKALPVIIGQITKNAQNGGADALASALRKHDGSELEKDPADENMINDGMKMLGHIFGSQEEAVEKNIGDHLGVSGDQAKQGLAMMAPLVMGALGKQQDEEKLDASGIADILQANKKAMESDSNIATDLMTSLIDQDGDGDILDDVGGFIGRFL